MRLLSLIASLWLAGCVSNVTCKPELVINTWKPIPGFPDTEPGQQTVRQRLANVESISFITCSYDDY